MSRRFTRAWLVCCVAFALIGCESDHEAKDNTNGNASLEDAGTVDAMVGDAAQPLDAAGHDAADANQRSEDGGQDSGPLPDGACNTLMVEGDATLPTAPQGQAPSPMGGVVPEGRFVVASYEVYGGNTGGRPQRGLYQITGNHIEYVFQEEGRPAETHSFDIATNGTTIVKTRTCPGPATQTDQYTATADELTFFRANALSTSVWRLVRAPK
jgi:hypothetical protein